MGIWHIQNVITKRVLNPTLSFRPNVIKMLVAEIGVEPDNYYLGLYFEACDSHMGQPPATVTWI